MLARPSVVAGQYYYNSSGAPANIDGPYEMAVQVAGVPEPEPSAWALMLIGFGGLGAAMRARRGRMAASA